MGQRTATETLFGIVAAFVEKRTWSQAELARRLETKPETIRKQMQELQAGGLPLEREEDHPHVYWSVPKNWLPGVLHFKPDEAADLLRLIQRAPPGALRSRVRDVTVSRLQSFGKASNGAAALGVNAPEDGAVRAGGLTDDEEQWLTVLEDALAKKSAVKLRYFTASRRNESHRFISAHRIDLTPKPCVVATCHKSNELRRFRLSNVLDAKLDAKEPFRSVAKADLAKFDESSMGGFRQDGPAVKCAFVVADTDAAWVARNLPDSRIQEESVAGGTRFSTETSNVQILARFVVGLGSSAKAETPELRKAVQALANGALGKQK